MREVEIRQLFLIILNTYSGFQYDDFKVAVWEELLRDTPFGLAQANLRRYIRNPENKYPPHPGVLAETASGGASGPDIPNAIETRRMLDEMDKTRLALMGPPKQLREAVKQLERLEHPSGPAES